MLERRMWKGKTYFPPRDMSEINRLQRHVDALIDSPLAASTFSFSAANQIR